MSTGCSTTSGSFRSRRVAFSTWIGRPEIDGRALRSHRLRRRAQSTTARREEARPSRFSERAAPAPASRRLKPVAMSNPTQSAIPRTIHTDPARLRQILINLVGNAIKFTDAGAVRLLTRFVNDGDAPCLQFDVIDTGRGIPKEEQEKSD